MLPRDSRFSTTPFVFPLFTFGLSHALSPPFHTICNFPATLLLSPLSLSLPFALITALFPSSFSRRESLYLVYTPVVAFRWLHTSQILAKRLSSSNRSKHCRRKSYNDINFIMKRETERERKCIYLYSIIFLKRSCRISQAYSSSCKNLRILEKYIV